jgi:hypothetical protein
MTEHYVHKGDDTLIVDEHGKVIRKFRRQRGADAAAQKPIAQSYRSHLCWMASQVLSSMSTGMPIICELHGGGRAGGHVVRVHDDVEIGKDAAKDGSRSTLRYELREGGSLELNKIAKLHIGTPSELRHILGAV